MKPLSAAAGLTLLLSCAVEQPERLPRQAGSAAARPAAFTMASRDRHLAGIESQLAKLGFADVSRFYEGQQFSLVSVRVPGSEAIESWKRLRHDVPATGAWPVIIGSSELESSLREHLEEDKDSVETVIRNGLELDLPAWRKAKQSADPETYTPPRSSFWKRLPASACRSDDQFVIHTDLTSSEPLPRVSIVLVPTTESWQVPAFLKFGGWNDCPMPSEHVAVLRDWQARFGADVVGMGTDIVELAVTSPVTDKAAALSVANEQFFYAYDVVHQGTGTLDCLAEQITGNTSWFFWWD